MTVIFQKVLMDFDEVFGGKVNEEVLNDVEFLPAEQCALGRDKQKGVCSDETLIRDISKKVLPKDKQQLPVKDLVDELQDNLDVENELGVVKYGLDNDLIDKDKGQEAINYHLAKVGPHNPNKWLSNTDIDDSLNRLSKNRPEYYHIPFHMIDFTTNPRGQMLAKLDLIKDVYEKGYKYAGCVLNTDTYSGSGQHWFAIFCDLSDIKNKGIMIEYFNSSATPLMYESLINWAQGNVVNCDSYLIKHKYNTRTEVIDVASVNGVQQQLSDDSANCGVYAIYYIWARVMNIPITFFKKRITKDQISEIRKLIFNSG